jgi:hypothetical protein
MFLLFFTAFVLVLGAAFLRHRAQLSRFKPTHRDSPALGSKLFRPWKNGKGQFFGYFRSPSTPRRLVLFFHESFGEALDWEWLDELVPLRDALVLVEYPGFGARAAEGKFVPALFHRCAEEAVGLAREKWGSTPILAIGDGFGAAVASYLASQGQVDRLALISPFTSSAPKFGKDKLRTESLLSKANAPLHVVQGTLDEMSEVRSAVDTYSGPSKALEEVPGFGHRNLAEAILHSPFSSRFRSFLTE